MKTNYIISVLFFALFVVMSGCKKNNPVSSNSNNGNVSFSVDIVHDAQNVNYFQFMPNTSVTITSVVGNCVAANVSNSVVKGDGTTVYNSTNLFIVSLNGVNVQSGQQWTFSIAGNIGSSQGKNYVAYTSYTIP